MKSSLLGAPNEASPGRAPNGPNAVTIDINEQALWEEMDSEAEDDSAQERRPDALKFIQKNLSKLGRRHTNQIAVPMSDTVQYTSGVSPRGDVELGAMSQMEHDSWGGSYHGEGDDEDMANILAKENDLDSFFSDVYYYFYEKGLVTIIAKKIVNIVTLGFMVVFSTFLIAFLDWKALASCDSEKNCKNFAEYIHWTSLPGNQVSRMVVLGYIALSSLYWLWNVCEAIFKIFTALRMHKFYRDHLQIETKELQTMEWDAVVKKLIPVATKSIRNKQASKELSAHVIASRIMRRDNYLIAFMNRGLLNMTVPLPFITNKMLISNYMEYYLRMLLINSMFDDTTFDIRADFLNDPRALKRRFFWTGIVLVFLTPFILLFMVMDFFMRNAQEWHSKKSYLGPRRYSAYAMWTFREFNELPHVLERRLIQSYAHGHKYLQQFQTHVVAIIARGLMFISGALVAVMLLFTVMDESILLYVHIFDKNLLFYITIFSAVFGVARALVPSPEDVVTDPERLMMKCAAYTHYMPFGWRDSCHTYDVQAQFAALFQYKAEILLQEILGVLCAPWILIVALPSTADDIIRFVREYTEKSPSLGAVCVYSQFDFARFGDPQFGHFRTGNYDGTRDVNNCARDGKMEKSFVNFKENHPDCRCPGEGGDWLLASVQSFSHRQNHRRMHDSLASDNSAANSMIQMQQFGTYMGGAMDGGAGGGGGAGASMGAGMGAPPDDGLHTPADSTTLDAIPEAGGGVGEGAGGSGGGGTSSSSPGASPESPKGMGSVLGLGSILGLGGAGAGAGVGNISLLASSMLGASTFRMPALAGGASMMQSSPSLALMQTLTDTAHENNFFWLQEYYASRQQPAASSNSSAQKSSTSDVAPAAPVHDPGAGAGAGSGSYATAPEAVRAALLKEATADL